MTPLEIPGLLRASGDAAAALAAILALLTGLWVWIGRPIRREWRTNREFQRQFRSDWLGEPDRPGVPARIGVMERLAEIGEGDARTDARVRKLERDHLTLRSQLQFLLKTCQRCPEQIPAPEDERG